MRGVLVDDHNAAAGTHDAAQLGDGPARQQGVLERLDADGGVELARRRPECWTRSPWRPASAVGEPGQRLGETSTPTSFACGSARRRCRRNRPLPQPTSMIRGAGPQAAARLEHRRQAAIVGVDLAGKVVLGGGECASHLPLKRLEEQRRGQRALGAQAVSRLAAPASRKAAAGFLTSGEGGQRPGRPDDTPLDGTRPEPSFCQVLARSARPAPETQPSLGSAGTSPPGVCRAAARRSAARATACSPRSASASMPYAHQCVGRVPASDVHGVQLSPQRASRQAFPFGFVQEPRGLEQRRQPRQGQRPRSPAVDRTRRRIAQPRQARGIELAAEERGGPANRCRHGGRGWPPHGHRPGSADSHRARSVHAASQRQAGRAGPATCGIARGALRRRESCRRKSCHRKNGYRAIASLAMLRPGGGDLQLAQPGGRGDRPAQGHGARRRCACAAANGRVRQPASANRTPLRPPAGVWGGSADSSSSPTAAAMPAAAARQRRLPGELADGRIAHGNPVLWLLSCEACRHYVDSRGCHQQQKSAARRQPKSPDFGQSLKTPLPSGDRSLLALQVGTSMK